MAPEVVVPPPPQPEPPAPAPSKQVVRDGPRAWNLTAVWGITFVVVAVLGGFMTPWEAIGSVLENEGAGDEGAELIAFVAGYTLPLTAGFAVIFFIMLRNSFEELMSAGFVVLAGIILWVAGALAGALGLGLLPDYSGVELGFDLRFLVVRVLQAYFNSYGFTLMLCSLVIAAASALQVDRWLTSEPDRAG